MYRLSCVLIATIVAISACKDSFTPSTSDASTDSLQRALSWGKEGATTERSDSCLEHKTSEKKYHVSMNCLTMKWDCVESWNSWLTSKD